MPYETPNGCVYDSGDYAGMLAMGKTLVGWDDWKRKQAAAREEGRWIGLGIGSTLDSGTNNFGQARIINAGAPFSGQSKAAIAKLDIYGEVVISMGSVPQGQGHETTAAQVVADVLGVSPGHVKVKPGFDTEQKRLHRSHRNVCQPVRSHGSLGHSRRGDQASKGNEPAGGLGAEGQRKGSGIWRRRARTGGPGQAIEEIHQLLGAREHCEREQRGHAREIVGCDA